MIKSSTHHFSFYYAELSTALKPSKLTITDLAFVHRLLSIMRYQVGDTFILFNTLVHGQATITVASKKSVEVTVTDVTKNILLEPEIVLFLPLVKKEALEQAVYNAVVAGVTKIQLVITEKCHRKTITETDYQRLEKIVIAAAEQSKYYAMPELLKPLEFTQALTLYKSYSFYLADPQGGALQKLSKKSVIMVGPEGDLTYDEKEELKKHKTSFFSLTPTILRSQEAVLVAISYARMI